MMPIVLQYNTLVKNKKEKADNYKISSCVTGSSLYFESYKSIFVGDSGSLKSSNFGKSSIVANPK